MAQENPLRDLEAQISAHYGPTPTRTIQTPVRDTITGQIRSEEMTLYTAIPANRRMCQLDSSGLKLRDSVKQPS